MIYIVKHNFLIKWLYINLGSLFFKVLGTFISIDSNMIIFVPNTGSSFSGSPRDIYQYLIKREEYANYRMIWAFNNPDYFSKQYGLETVKLDTIQYFIMTLRAKYWVSDINIERGLRYKKSKQIFLNTWHGVAIKKIGNDDPKSARYDYSDIDYLCVSGTHDKEVFSSALNASESSFLPVGMPRNDRLLSYQREDVDKIKEKLRIPKNKKVILYAPTWRDSKNQGKSYELKIPADFSTWYSRLNEDYILLIRTHSRTTDLLNVKFDQQVINCSDYPDLNDLLLISDVLISDYSSVIFDYSLLEKPYFCFGYDYDSYLEERGWYVEPAELFPYGVIRSEDVLLETILNHDTSYVIDFVKRIRHTYMNYSAGNATEKCVRALFSKTDGVIDGKY